MLGDNESGRSTLASRLKGVETVNKGIGLEYHYIDIKDEDRDGKKPPKMRYIYIYIYINRSRFGNHKFQNFT